MKDLIDRYNYAKMEDKLKGKCNACNETNTYLEWNSATIGYCNTPQITTFHSAYEQNRICWFICPSCEKRQYTKDIRFILPN